MTLKQRMNIERAKLGWKFPTTPEEVGATEEKETPSFPTGKPVIMSLEGVPSVVALHTFEDEDVWLVRLHDYSDDWVTIRRATEIDKAAITTEIRRERQGLR